MSFSHFLASAAMRANRALSVIAADARLRTIVGALVSGALGQFGLHASAEAVSGLIVVGGALAGMGPHLPSEA